MVQTISSGKSGKQACKVPWQSEVKNTPIHKQQKLITSSPPPSFSIYGYGGGGALRTYTGEAARAMPCFHCEWETYVQVTKCVWKSQPAQPCSSPATHTHPPATYGFSVTAGSPSDPTLLFLGTDLPAKASKDPALCDALVTHLAAT